MFLSPTNNIFRATRDDSIRGSRLDKSGIIILFYLRSPRVCYSKIHVGWGEGARLGLVNEDQGSGGCNLWHDTDWTCLRGTHVLLQDGLHELFNEDARLGALLTLSSFSLERIKQILCLLEVSFYF